MADLTLTPKDYNYLLAMINHEAGNTISNSLKKGDTNDALGQIAGLAETWMNRAAIKGASMEDVMYHPQLSHFPTKAAPDYGLIQSKATSLDPRIKEIFDGYLYNRAQGEEGLLGKVNQYLNRDVTDALYSQKYRDWYDKSDVLGAYGDKRSGGKSSLQQEFLHNPEMAIPDYTLKVSPEIRLSPSEAAVDNFAAFKNSYQPPPREIANAPLPPERPDELRPDGFAGPINAFSDAITSGLEGAGRAVADVATNVGDTLTGMFTPAAAEASGWSGSPAPGPTDFSNANVSANVGGGSFNPVLAPFQPAPGSTDFSNANVSSGVGNGSLNPVLASYQPAPGAADFSGANVSAGVQNGVLNPLLQGLTSQPAPTVPAPAPAPLVASGSPAQQVAGIYQAVLGRAPEQSAVDYWSAVLNSGQSDFNGIVAKVQASPEAQARGISPQATAPTIAAPQTSPNVAAPAPTQTTPAPSAVSSLPPNATNEQKVINTYETVQGRTPGTGEVGYWSEMLRRGLSLSDFDAQIRASPEAQARINSFPSQTAPTIAAPSATPTVASQGLSPLAPSQEAATIAAPPVTPTIPNTGTPEQQIAAVYQNVLGREGGPGEVGYWSAVLKSGQNDLNSIVAQFQASPEAKTRPAPQGLSPLTATQTAPTIAAPSAVQGLSPLNVASTPAPQTTPTVSAQPAPTISAGSPAQIVNEIYQAELGRPAEAGALAYGTAVLNSGKLTAADFAAQVRNSPEAQARRNSFPSQDAPAIPAPAATAPVENFGMTPTIGAPAATPTIAPSFAPTIAPTQAPTIAAPPAIQATSPSSISPYGFSTSNVSTGFGAIPQTFGSYYGPSGSSTTNLGLDLPTAASDPVSDFSFSNANVGGFDVNAPGIGAAPQAQASDALPGGFGFDPQQSENAYLRGQATNIISADMLSKGTGNGQNALIVNGPNGNDAGLNDMVSRANTASLQAFQQNIGKPTVAAAPVNVPRIAQGAFSPAPFYGRW